MKCTMPWKYWKSIDKGNTILFNTTTCEKCGCVVMDVNSIGGSQKDIWKYKKRGMTEWTDPIPWNELGWCDVPGMAVCTNCYVDGNKERGNKERENEEAENS